MHAQNYRHIFEVAIVVCYIRKSETSFHVAHYVLIHRGCIRILPTEQGCMNDHGTGMVLIYNARKYRLRQLIQFVRKCVHTPRAA
jgi:hypothetical protein